MKNLDSNSFSVKKQIASSYLAGLISSVISHPLWTLRLRVSQISIQKSEKFVKGLSVLIRLLINSFSSISKFKGLYSGIVPTFLLTMHPAIQMTTYQIIKNRKKEAEFRKKWSIIAGSASQMLASIFTFPINMIKSKQQQLSQVEDPKLNNFLYENKFNTKKYASFIISVKSIHIEFGFLGFYRGMSFLLIKNLVRGAIFFYSFEQINFKLT